MSWSFITGKWISQARNLLNRGDELAMNKSAVAFVLKWTALDALQTG